MKILYLVQRYGEDIVGGSEAACRAFAEELVKAGHHVEVLTSCAKDYVTWADHYAPGHSVLNGVIVHRLPVVAPRNPEIFGPLDRRLMTDASRAFHYENIRWAHQMGPHLSGFASWLIENHSRFDVAIFMTYLYATSTIGIPILSGRLPIIFQPTAHTEPALRANLFESTFRLVDSFLFFTPEEREIVANRFRIEPHGQVAGIGIDIHPTTASVEQVLRKYKLDTPYLVYVGRIDPMKGVREVIAFHEAMHRRNPGLDLDFVLVGEKIAELPDVPRVKFTGYLEPSEKQAVLRGSRALIQSSYFESFSIVLCEAWVQRRPVLAQGACSVLRGQVNRSNGGIAYQGFAEFEQAVDMLSDLSMASQLGSNGYEYVAREYQWPTVLAKVENAIDIAQINFSRKTNFNN